MLEFFLARGTLEACRIWGSRSEANGQLLEMYRGSIPSFRLVGVDTDRSSDLGSLRWRTDFVASMTVLRL